MTEYIAGLICALVLAAFLILWLIYYMFVRERHKNEPLYSVSDIIKRNQELELERNAEKCPEKKVGLSAGIFILPTRHKHQDEYVQRPDYPEGPPPASLHLSSEKLVEFLSENANDDFYNDGTLEIDSNATYISDV